MRDLTASLTCFAIMAFSLGFGGSQGAGSGGGGGGSYSAGDGLTLTSTTFDIAAGDADLLTGGGAEIDGDKLDVDFTPSNYTPSTSPSEADNADNLTAHLSGIDTALASASGVVWDDDTDKPLELRSDNVLGFSNSASNTTTIDVQIERDSAGILQVTNPAGTGGALRIGGGTLASAAGDLSAGNGTTFNLFYDQDVGYLTLYDSSGARGVRLRPAQSGNGFMSMNSTSQYGWDSETNDADTIDTSLIRDSAGVVAVSDGSTGAGSGSIITSSTIVQNATSGARMTLSSYTESVSTSSGAEVTATMEGVPPRALIMGVVCEVTTTVTGPFHFSVGVSGDPNAWGDSIALTAGTKTDSSNWSTWPNFTHYTTKSNQNVASGAVVFTANGSDFSGGVIRITVFYWHCEIP